MSTTSSIFSKKYLPAHLLVLSGFFFVLLAYYSEGTFDTGDGIRHYMISRYSWNHPELFLDSWGKPFYTLVSSPFSQYGLMGITIFNILCGMGSAYFCLKIAQGLGLNYTFLVVPFLFFATIYFPVMNSGLTEPLFGFVLIASVYLMFSDKYKWACILISFLPFVRSEGFFILPLFFVFLLYTKQFRLIPLLGLGTLLYSIIGGFYYADFLWIKNKNPYDGTAQDFYGKGDLFHFVDTYEFIWGAALRIFLVLGLLAWIPPLLKKKEPEKSEKKSFLKAKEILLIYGPFIVYFVSHSIMWWQGWANSLGLVRVLAAVMPCSALICLRGFNVAMIPLLRKNVLLEFYIIVLVLFMIIKSPFELYYFPFKLTSEETTIKEAGEWFQKSPYKNKKVFFLHPYLSHVLEIDPFDSKKAGELWGFYSSLNKYGDKFVPDSSIVFWDAHFGPNECRIPLDTLLNDARFELVKSFKPAVDITVLGERTFAVHAFMKLPKPMKWHVIKKDSCDFEQNFPDANVVQTEESVNAHSGKKVSVLNKMKEYSYTFTYKASALPNLTSEIEFNSYIYSNDSLKNFVLVCSVSDTLGKSVFWEGRKNNKTLKTNEWNYIHESFPINKDSLASTDEIKFFIWNKEKEVFRIDDMEILFKGKY